MSLHRLDAPSKDTGLATPISNMGKNFSLCILGLLSFSQPVTYSISLEVNHTQKKRMCSWLNLVSYFLAYPDQLNKE
uniref:Uncharacterized protein n=1 Tax=Aegilops tauschii subsp. strangulata TaxID=200361 RepID=A0A453H4R7_AEGTS